MTGNDKNTTPRPWRVERVADTMPGEDVTAIVGPMGTIATMASVMREHRAERDTNAALIVRAVNSYDAMRKALACVEEALEVLARDIENGWPPHETVPIIREQRQAILAALALANGEGESK
jgi:hypothetical protein